jgi:hypothetical protein
MDVDHNETTPSSQRFSCNDLNKDDNSHDNENDVAHLMVEDKKDYGQVDTDVRNWTTPPNRHITEQHTKITTVPPVMRTK